MKNKSADAAPLQAYTSFEIVRSRQRAKLGALLAMASVIAFVCLTCAVAVLSGAAGHIGYGSERSLRAGMSVALLGFFVGSHVWMLAPFFYKKETSRRRLEALRRLGLLVPEVASMLNEVDAQRRPVLRGEVDQALKRHRKLLTAPAPRMRLV